MCIALAGYHITGDFLPSILFQILLTKQIQNDVMAPNDDVMPFHVFLFEDCLTAYTFIQRWQTSTNPSYLRRTAML